MKSTLRTTAEILILIGAILSTIYSSFILLATFWLILPIIWFAAVITFTWVTRHQAIAKDSRAWIIFGIVLSTFGNWVGLAGYICLLIEHIRNEQTNATLDHNINDSNKNNETNETFESVDQNEVK